MSLGQTTPPALRLTVSSLNTALKLSFPQTNKRIKPHKDLCTRELHWVTVRSHLGFPGTILEILPKLSVMHPRLKKEEVWV